MQEQEYSIGMDNDSGVVQRPLGGSMLTIQAIPGAPLETNCYYVAESDVGQALLLDAPWQIVDEVLQRAERTGTGSRDRVHARALGSYHGRSRADRRDRRADGVPSAGQRAAAAPELRPVQPALRAQIRRRRSAAGGRGYRHLGQHHFTVLHTPGHTPGSICLYSAEEGILFSGDTLFAGACGRMDFPGGNPAQMVRSLQRLRELPPETLVYPGHGPATTIGAESWLAQAEELEEM